MSRSSRTTQKCGDSGSHRSPYNLRKGSATTSVMTFEEADRALEEAGKNSGMKFVEKKSYTTADAAEDSVSPYTDEIAELFQEEFARELAEYGAVYSPPLFPHPCEDGVGDVGDTDCGVCYACTTMDGECVDEQPAGTFLNWWRGQVKEALKRWA